MFKSVLAQQYLMFTIFKNVYSSKRKNSINVKLSENCPKISESPKLLEYPKFPETQTKPENNARFSSNADRPLNSIWQQETRRSPLEQV